MSYLRSSLPGPRTFFYSIFAGFSLPCLLATAILDSSYSNYLTERSNEELKSKGRIEREIQWGSKVKGFSVSRKTSPRECPALGKGVLTSSIHRWAGQTISPGAEQKHFSLQSSRGAGFPRQATEYDCNNKSKSKKQFPTRSQIWLSP